MLMTLLKSVSISFFSLFMAFLLIETDSEIPSHIVYDRTSQGLVWDPTLSAYYYTYSMSTSAFTPAVANTPTGYLYFQGRWGDQQYLDDVKGQEEFHGFRKWTDHFSNFWIERTFVGRQSGSVLYKR